MNFDILFMDGPLLISFLIATVFIGYLIIFSKSKVLLRFIVIPVWFAFSVFLLQTVFSLLGHPIPKFPPHNSILIGHVVNLDAERNKTIVFVIRDPKTLRVRLYEIPYTRQMEKKIKNNSKGKDGKRKGNQERRIINNEANQTIESRNIKHRGLPPKGSD